MMLSPEYRIVHLRNSGTGSHIVLRHPSNDVSKEAERFDGSTPLKLGAGLGRGMLGKLVKKAGLRGGT